MINASSSPFVIVAKSEMLGGKFAPTLHGEFPSYGAAYQHAAENIKHTEFKVLTAKEAGQEVAR